MCSAWDRVSSGLNSPTRSLRHFYLQISSAMIPGRNGMPGGSPKSESWKIAGNTMTIQKLYSLGQSLWYDNIQRRLLENGELAAMITRGDIRGVTSNPSIFLNAITKPKDYEPA